MRKDARPGSSSLSSWMILFVAGSLATSLALLLAGCMGRWNPRSPDDTSGPYSGVLEDSDDNVILVTWDGVRPHELSSGADPELIRRGKLQGTEWAKATPRDIAPFLVGSTESGQSLFWGDGAPSTSSGDGAPSRAPSTFRVSAPSFISLPSYQAMLGGRIRSCGTNSCGIPDEETLLDRLHRELAMGYNQVALIASWDKMDRAASHFPLGKRPFLVNAGFELFPPQTRDGAHAEIERRQNEDRPIWSNSRKDRYTMEHALHFIRQNEPRFLMISLVDPDEWAHHSGDHPESYARYLDSVRQADQGLRELTELLSQMGDYGKNTTIIATTDHGRGEGEDFDHHDRGTPGSEKAWAWIWGNRVQKRGTEHQNQNPENPGELAAPGQKQTRPIVPVADRIPASSSRAPKSHIDLRPTIERWFGLAPMTCPDCGRSIPL